MMLPGAVMKGVIAGLNSLMKILTKWLILEHQMAQESQSVMPRTPNQMTDNYSAYFMKFAICTGESMSQGLLIGTTTTK